MPTIDTAAIEGFEAMSDAEKVTALLGMEIPEAVDLKDYVKKSVFDAKATEASNLSKQLRSKMSEDEVAADEAKRLQEENDQKYRDLEEKYNALMRESVVSKYKTSYMEQGYDAKLAGEAAEAMADGQMDKVLECNRKFLAGYHKQVEDELARKTRRPDGSFADGNKDQEASSVAQAREIGKKKAATNAVTNDVMSHYIK